MIKKISWAKALDPIFLSPMGPQLFAFGLGPQTLATHHHYSTKRLSVTKPTKIKKKKKQFHIPCRHKGEKKQNDESDRRT